MNYVWIIEARPVKGNRKWGICETQVFTAKTHAAREISRVSGAWPGVEFRAVKYQREDEA